VGSGAATCLGSDGSRSARTCRWRRVPEGSAGHGVVPGGEKPPRQRLRCRRRALRRMRVRPAFAGCVGACAVSFP
jgi:hypothetical protein